ncbi:MAG: hypothetical protein R3A46_12620 [Thermomicrobiales bacterium]
MAGLDISDELDQRPDPHVRKIFGRMGVEAEVLDAEPVFAWIRRRAHDGKLADWDGVCVVSRQDIHQALRRTCMAGQLDNPQVAGRERIPDAVTTGPSEEAEAPSPAFFVNPLTL